LALMTPTLLAAVYYLGIATDRYASEARFVIRSASKPANALGGLSALMKFVGVSKSEDDTFAVRDFLTSRDAVKQLRDRFDLVAMYEYPGADFLARYPSLLFHRSDEEFYRYFQTMISVVTNNSTDLVTLRVQAFRAADAEHIARVMIELGEELVNRLNERM